MSTMMNKDRMATTPGGVPSMDPKTQQTINLAKNLPQVIQHRILSTKPIEWMIAGVISFFGVAVLHYLGKDKEDSLMGLPLLMHTALTAVVAQLLKAEPLHHQWAWATLIFSLVAFVLPASYSFIPFIIGLLVPAIGFVLENTRMPQSHGAPVMHPDRMKKPNE
ncbi:hypothetical protein QOT17_015638 [Balamuthia mandrillaris]